VRRLLAALVAEQPRAVEALGRAAQLCADDHAFIQAQLDAAWPALADERPDSVQLRRAPWEALHVALQRYALRRAAALLGAPELSLPQVEAARALAARPGRQMRLGPALRLHVEQAGLTLARPGAAARPDGPQLAVAELALPLPGGVALGAGWRCVAGAEPPDAPAPWRVALDPAALDGPLALRRRRPGDRIWPAGGRGGRKLQDFFVDQRLPRPLRDAWPILATPAAVVWVPGLRADQRFLATEQSQGTIWVAVVRDVEE
jgi:tRNA(Ile)-lysidine synthetase-like protein